MNGAASLIQTLVNGGVEVCFTNPGTSEMHFVAALDDVVGMRCVLCLFEGVVSGAALGYAAMARKPACTLLHLGPGLGNAVANLHNAGKAHLWACPRRLRAVPRASANCSPAGSPRRGPS